MTIRTVETTVAILLIFGIIIMLSLNWDLLKSKEHVSYKEGYNDTKYPAKLLFSIDGHNVWRIQDTEEKKVCYFYNICIDGTDIKCYEWQEGGIDCI